MKSDFKIGLNKVVIPKNKQGFSGSRNYLCNLGLSTAPLDFKFDVDLISSVAVMMRLITEIKPNISTSKKPLLALLLR